MKVRNGFMRLSVVKLVGSLEKRCLGPIGMIRGTRGLSFREEADLLLIVRISLDQTFSPFIWHATHVQIAFR